LFIAHFEDGDKGCESHPILETWYLAEVRF